jgi:hypothetical protein
VGRCRGRKLLERKIKLINNLNMSILTPESFVLMQVQVALFFAPNSEKLDDNDKFYELTKEMGIKKILS